MSSSKPRMLPARVPWMVTRSAPFLRVDSERLPHQLCVEFVAHFETNGIAPEGAAKPEYRIASQPPLFELGDLGEAAPYRLVRVYFSEPLAHRLLPSASDREVVPEEDFDWSAVTSRLRPGEGIKENLERRRRQWVTTGICPNPCFYEVGNSPWPSQVAQKNPVFELHHYIVLGQDDYVEVIAADWRWEPGQPVE
jgi:hypothetical protein